jgi:[ribosomal protein S5]-alanine N-acetyltransferase
MSPASVPDSLATARLELRPWRIDDVEAVLAYADDAQWARYLPVPWPYLRQHAVEFIARQLLLDRQLHPSWAIVSSQKVIGGINIRFLAEHRAASIGWSMARRVWGQGLVTEAASSVIDAAFAGHGKLNRIEASADLRNLASRRVMEKLGMKHEGVLRQSRVARGELIDMAYYSVVRSEWQARI